MSDSPLVSWICPTYNRPPGYLHLLEETVECFVRQEGMPPGSLELVIINDCQQQMLRCDVPGVRIVNLPERCASLGEKYNMAIVMARGQLLMPAEDDDLSLPWRTRQAVDMLGDQDYWLPPQVWFLQKDHPPIWRHAVGVRHHASIFRRSAWRQAGGYPPRSGSQDMMFDSALRANCRHLIPIAIGSPETIMPVKDWAYVYRWGSSNVHLSGVAAHDDFYAQVGKMPVVPGTYQIQPRWQQDYVKLTREAIRAA